MNKMSLIWICLALFACSPISGNELNSFDKVSKLKLPPIKSVYMLEHNECLSQDFLIQFECNAKAFFDQTPYYSKKLEDIGDFECYFIELSQMQKANDSIKCFVDGVEVDVLLLYQPASQRSFLSFAAYTFQIDSIDYHMNYEIKHDSIMVLEEKVGLTEKGECLVVATHHITIPEGKERYSTHQYHYLQKENPAISQYLITQRDIPEDTLGLALLPEIRFIKYLHIDTDFSREMYKTYEYQVAEKLLDNVFYYHKKLKNISKYELYEVEISCRPEYQNESLCPPDYHWTGGILGFLYVYDPDLKAAYVFNSSYGYYIDADHSMHYGLFSKEDKISLTENMMTDDSLEEDYDPSDEIVAQHMLRISPQGEVQIESIHFWK